MPGRRVLTQCSANFILDFIGQPEAWCKLDEQDHALVITIILPNREAICNLGQLLHLGIDFGRSDTNTRRFQHCIRATVEGDPTRIAVDQYVIAMPPNVWIY